MKTLVVEDVFFSVESGVTKLYQGYNVEKIEILLPKNILLATNLVGARKILSEEKVDFVISDLGFPFSETRRHCDELSKKWQESPIENAVQMNDRISRELEQMGSAFASRYTFNGDAKRMVEDDLGKAFYPDQYSQQPLGVLVAQECLIRNIPFTVYTSDIGHGLPGLLLLVVAEVVSPQSVAEVCLNDEREALLLAPVARQEADREDGKEAEYTWKSRLWKMRQRNVLSISTDRKVAAGGKENLDNWQKLFHALGIK